MGAAEPEEPIICFIFCVIRKASDLSDCDRGHIAMAWRLGKSIPKTEELMGCLRSTDVNF